MKRPLLLLALLLSAMLMRAQSEATDVTTSLVKNPDFENGLASWTATGYATQTNSEFAGRVNTAYCERWVAGPKTLSNSTCSQLISVTNGVYLLTAHAGAIQQSDTNLEPTGVYIFANDAEVAVTGAPSVVNLYSVMTEVTNGSLSIGHKVDGTNCNWVQWDDIHLYYFGDTSMADAQASFERDAMRQVAEKASNILDEYMCEATRNAFLANVELIDSRTAADAADALAEMQAQYEEMVAEVAIYLAMIELIEVASEELDDVTKTFKKQELEEAIGIAEGQWSDAEFDAAAMTEAYAAFKAVYDDFLQANLTGSDKMDYTDRISNPSVQKNTTGWTSLVAAAVEHGVQEFYNDPARQLDFHQTIKGLPDGKYTVTVQAFFRPGGNDAGAAHDAGTENISAYLYANAKKKPLHSLYDYTASQMGVTSSDVLNDYVNMRVAVNEAFNLVNPDDDLPYYTNSLDVTVLGGELTIGIACPMAVQYSWLPFRNFTLSYWGYFPGIVLQGTIDEINEYLETNEIVQRFEGLCIVLEDACIEYEDYTDLDDNEEVQQKCDELDELFAGVQQAVADIATIEETLASVLELLEGDEEYPGYDDLVDIYMEVQEFIDAGGTEDTTPEMVTEYLEMLTQGIIDYYQSQEATHENPANYNFLLTNPELTTSSDGWSGSAPTVNYNICEFYNCDFDIHQTLTVPNGVYRVGVSGFYREGANDGGSNYAAGAETITAKLYANTASAPLLSLYTHTADEFDSNENLNNYVNNMENAGYAFDAGLYQGVDGLDAGNFVTVIVYDGQLTIGIRNVGHAESCWCAFRGFTLQYLGEATSEDMTEAWDATKGDAEEILSVLLPGDKSALQTIYEQALQLAADGNLVDAVALLSPAVTDNEGIYATTNSFFSGNYKALKDMTTDEAVSAEVKEFVGALLAMADARLFADDATTIILSGLNDRLGGYIRYLNYYREVEEMLASGTYKHYVDEVKAMMADHRATLVTEIFGSDTLDEFIERLKAQVGVMEMAAVVYTIKEGDVTVLIRDADLSASATGWTIEKGTGNGPTNTKEHYSGVTTNRYLDSWNASAGVLDFSAYQVINGLPNGTYALSCAARTDGDNAFIFAATDSIASANTLFTMIENCNNVGGAIWLADSIAWAEGGEASEVFNANGGLGYGWGYVTVNDINVTNHLLIIGMTVNSAYTGQPFNGTWFSADDWKLTLVKKSDNDGQWNIENSIDSVEAPVTVEYYTVGGMRIAEPVQGIVIVRTLNGDGTITLRKMQVR